MDEAERKKYTKATQEAAHWKAQAANLQDLVDSQYDRDQVPLLRRVIMQRREIRAAWASSNMYQRMWRAATGRLGKSWNESPEGVIEKALNALSDPTKRASARVAEAKKILGG